RGGVGRRGEPLRGEKSWEQAGQGAPRLVELDGGRAPVRKGARRLAAGEPERVALSLGVEAEQLAGRGRAAEGADHARRMPAAGAERGVFGAEADAHRGFEPGDD